MSTLGEINAILAGIQKDLQAIDLTKETDIKKIQGMATKPISEVDKAVTREDFGEEHLDVTIGMFQEASDRVGTYDKKQDIEEAKKVIGDATKVKEISDRMKAKEKVKDEIKGKYDELTRKKAVIDKYKEKYNPDHLAERQNDKLEANKKKIADNKAKIGEISEFRNSVSGELGVITTNLELIEELDKLEKLDADIKKREANVNVLKSQGLDPDLIKNLEEDLNKSKGELKTKTGELTKKHKGITLDPNDLTTSINTAKSTAQSNIDKAKVGIKDKAQKSDKEYIKKDIYDRLDKAPNDKAFAQVLDETTSELRIENRNLDEENKKIEKNVEVIALGKQVKATGTAAITVDEPTEEEIDQLINTDGTIRALAPVLSQEEMQQKVYESLADGHKGIFGRHPIAFLKSRFSKNAQEAWKKSYEKDMRKKAAEKIKAARQEEADKNKSALREADTKESAFRRTLFQHVMQADGNAVKTMDENAKKRPGAVLEGVYDQMEADEAKKEEQEEQESGR